MNNVSCKGHDLVRREPEARSQRASTTPRTCPDHACESPNQCQHRTSNWCSHSICVSCMHHQRTRARDTRRRRGHAHFAGESPLGASTLRLLCNDRVDAPVVGGRGRRQRVVCVHLVVTKMQSPARTQNGFSKQTVPRSKLSDGFTIRTCLRLRQRPACVCSPHLPLPYRWLSAAADCPAG